MLERRAPRASGSSRQARPSRTSSSSASATRCAERRAAAPRCHRAPDRVVRRARRAPHHGRNARRDRRPRPGARRTCPPSPLRPVKASRRFVGNRRRGRESRPVAELSCAVGRPPGARRANRTSSMRTTLKRGLGRGAAPNGNGKAVLPPGASSPVTLYRQPERVGALARRRSSAGRDVARDRVPRRRDRHRGWRVPLLPRVGRRGRGEDARGAARRRAQLDVAAAGPARRRARHRLRRAQG